MICDRENIRDLCWKLVDKSVEDDGMYEYYRDLMIEPDDEDDSYNTVGGSYVSQSFPPSNKPLLST